METGFNAAVAQTDFLQLLTTQLKHQDPFEPVKQENFIAQLAQFSTLEGIEKLNTSFGSMLRFQEISQGLDLVGKSADFIDPISGEQKGGLISEMYVDQGTVMLIINGDAVPVELIAGVRA